VLRAHRSWSQSGWALNFPPKSHQTDWKKSELGCYCCQSRYFREKVLRAHKRWLAAGLGPEVAAEVATDRLEDISRAHPLRTYYPVKVSITFP